MTEPTEEQLEALAERLVRDAVAEYSGAFPNEVLEVIRQRMLADYLTTPDGRLRLRQCLVEPLLDKSSNRDTGPAEVANDAEEAS